MAKENPGFDDSILLTAEGERFPAGNRQNCPELGMLFGKKQVPADTGYTQHDRPESKSTICNYGLKVEITEEKLTKAINKFCSNRKIPKRPAVKSTTNNRGGMPPAKKHAPSRHNILEYDGLPPSQLIELGGQSNQNSVICDPKNYFYNSNISNGCNDNYAISQAITLSTNMK
ncbi:hypothetical protein PV325_008763 [Microctonus aethiopoides]|nr:hypothetical protein PV325_008763 [Microctonus aethiopoides]KAK0076628.1 hypothetical protein PV326_010636 [Microctonus aethiopoides]